jgi:hypothetical protein
MLPLISFETGRKHKLNLLGSRKALRQQMEVWFYFRNHGREANTRGDEIRKNLHRAPPERVGRAFALLTKTYHGSRVTGHVPL